MEISATTIYDFRKYFSGNTDGFYTFGMGPKVNAGGKQEGAYIARKELITDSDYLDHLNGKEGLLVIPINKNNKCRFSVLDVDKYGTEFKRTVAMIYKNRLPLFPFRSKSGGLHVYLFFDDFIPAKTARDYMDRFRRLLLLDSSTEIFPKQVSIEEGALGSGINIPYFNTMHPDRYMYDEKFDAIILEEALELIRSSEQNETKLKSFFDLIPIDDGPPCLEALHLNAGGFTARNNYLFSLAVYYKARDGDDFEFSLQKANLELDNPIPLEELQKTIVASHKKKDYSYKCNDQPLCDFCDKGECKKRRFGIGGKEIADLNYEELCQYIGLDEAYYEWKINSKILKFFSERELIDQESFRQQCVKSLHIFPKKLTNEAWTSVINRALGNIEVKKIDIEDDVSPSAIFREYLIEFLTRRAPAETPSQLLVDRVYKDKVANRFLFKGIQLYNFVTYQKQFRFYGSQQIQDKLRQLGGAPIRLFIAEKKEAIRVWSLPADALNIIEDDKDTLSVDFLDKMEDKPY